MCLIRHWVFPKFLGCGNFHALTEEVRQTWPLGNQVTKYTYSNEHSMSNDRQNRVQEILSDWYHEGTQGVLKVLKLYLDSEDRLSCLLNHNSCSKPKWAAGDNFNQPNGFSTVKNTWIPSWSCPSVDHFLYYLHMYIVVLATIAPGMFIYKGTLISDLNEQRSNQSYMYLFYKTLEFQECFLNCL